MKVSRSHRPTKVGIVGARGRVHQRERPASLPGDIALQGRELVWRAFGGSRSRNPSNHFAMLRKFKAVFQG